MTIDPKKLSPTPGYVLVEPAKKQTQTTGGIYLPDAAGDKPQEGTVLAVGSDWNTEAGATIKSPVKVGARVVYKKWGGNDVRVGDIEYQFLKFEDILATIQ